jgi:hypothetical protein
MGLNLCKCMNLGSIRAYMNLSFHLGSNNHFLEHISLKITQGNWNLGRQISTTTWFNCITFWECWIAETDFHMVIISEQGMGEFWTGVSSQKYTSNTQTILLPANFKGRVQLLGRFKMGNNLWSCVKVGFEQNSNLQENIDPSWKVQKNTTG